MPDLEVISVDWLVVFIVHHQSQPEASLPFSGSAAVWYMGEGKSEEGEEDQSRVPCCFAGAMGVDWVVGLGQGWFWVAVHLSVSLVCVPNGIWLTFSRALWLCWRHWLESNEEGV